MEEKKGFTLPISEYAERKRVERESALETISQPIKFPKALTRSYYDSKVEQYPFKSKEGKLWLAFKNYAVAVQKFYCAVMTVFNKTLYAPVQLPEYVSQEFHPTQDFQHDLATLETLSKQLVKAESDLVDCLEDNRTSITARCNKHSALKELRDFAAKAWLVYCNMQRDNFYHAVVDFKSRNEDKDLSDDRNISLLFMGHIKTKNFVLTKVRNFFSPKAYNSQFKKLQPKSSKLYIDLDAESLFEEIMSNFKGYDYKEKEEFFQEALLNITDEKALMVINLYKNYADIKSVYKRLFFIYNEIETYKCIKDYRDVDNPNRDLFVVAKNYYEQISSVLEMAKENEEYSFLIKDCLFLQNKLKQALEINKESHHDWEQKREEALKLFPFSKNNISEP